MLAFRKLNAGETDHEVIWPMVSAACLILALIWIRLQLPVPACAFHAATGLPCPTCGATRAVVALLDGKVWEAWKLNPLVFASISAICVFDAYAVIAWWLRGWRLRTTFGPTLQRAAVRGAVIGAVALNWIYLVQRGDI